MNEHDKACVVALLYILMRDHLPTGVVVGILRNHVAEATPSDEYTAEHLHEYAKQLASEFM